MIKIPDHLTDEEVAPANCALATVVAGWEAAAEWWQILASHAPMRPEAVAGLLNSLAKAGREEEAARAFAEYVERLRKAGGSRLR